MFGDIVRLLELSDMKRVDYVILCLGNTIHNDNVEVLAFRTGDIKKQCERQNINIYEYAGDDWLLTNFQTMEKDVQINPSFSTNGDNIEVIFDHFASEILPEQKMDFIMHGVYRAHYAIKNGRNYATTLLVQGIIDIYGDDIVGWMGSDKVDEIWKVKPIFGPINQETINSKIQAFEEKWMTFSDNEV